MKHPVIELDHISFSIVEANWKLYSLIPSTMAAVNSHLFRICPLFPNVIVNVRKRSPVLMLPVLVGVALGIYGLLTWHSV